MIPQTYPCSLNTGPPPGSLLAGAGCGGRVQAVDVAFRVLEHGPASPGLGPRLLGELHAALLEFLGGLVDVVDLEDDAAEAADLLRLVGKAQREGERGLRALGRHGHPARPIAHRHVHGLLPAELLGVEADRPIDVVDEERHYGDVHLHVIELLSASTPIALMAASAKDPVG